MSMLWMKQRWSPNTVYSVVATKRHPFYSSNNSVKSRPIFIISNNRISEDICNHKIVMFPDSAAYYFWKSLADSDKTCCIVSWICLPQRNINVFSLSTEECIYIPLWKIKRWRFYGPQCILPTTFVYFNRGIQSKYMYVHQLHRVSATRTT